MTRRGFTIIELLIVIAVLGILAGLAYAKLQSNKDKAIVASMKSDLHAIAEEQEAYYFQNRDYTTQLNLLNANPTIGNTITITEASPSGWSGNVANPKVATVCYVFVGTAAPVGSATQDGVVDCS